MQTLDDTSGEPCNFPTKGYIRELVRHWSEHFETGEPLLIRKSRRMVVSWTFRALELHQAGLRRSAFAIACQDFDDSAEMIWRVGWMYENLQERFPKWNLPKMRKWRGAAPQRLTAVELDNGSSFSPLTGRDPNTFRQKGVTGVALEECAHFSHLASVYANAATMCKGRPGHKSGLLTLVSTVNGANKEWMRLSKPNK